MYFLIKPLFVALVVQDVYSSTCSVCVTEPLITSPVKCPICNQSDLDGYKNQSQYESITSGYISDIPYNWTTCNVEASSCNASYKYRSINGSCNNLKHPTWGMSNTAYMRLLPAYYKDGKHEIALATNGDQRPLARILSVDLLAEKDIPDNVTLIAMQWGQVVAHDSAISSPPDRSIDCCSGPAMNNKSICLPIAVASNDPFYSQFNVTCISEVRTKVTLTGSCKASGPDQQVNGVTHVVDASLVYGSTTDKANNLRTLTGGKLRFQISKDGRKFLPNVPLDQVQSQCFVKNITEPCYVAGDVRVNQNSELTVLQNVLLREHNRIAGKLEKLHPKWDDETLYQETRAILIAEFQHITYKEWLVYYIGKENMEKHKLFPNQDGYTKYNSNVNLMTINSFTTAAYRFAHSGIQGFLNMLNYNRVTVDKVPISNWMDRPCIVQAKGNLDKFLLGLTKQPMQDFDEFYSKQITTLLFHGFAQYGQDLQSLDIERGRDHGLGPYIYYLEICTGHKVQGFEDLNKYIPQKFITKLANHYNSVKDIDLFIGGVFETNVQGTRFGPTFVCIITEQFYRKKWGDRFWYEVGGQTHSFTKDQLREIRKASLSRLICNNGDHITTIAPNSFLPPSKTNKLIPCSKIPDMNLNKWK